MADNNNPPVTGQQVDDQFGRLFKVLGFDPSKEIGPKDSAGGSVFTEAMKEVVKERAEANKVKAVVLIKQSIDLKAKWDEEEKKFLASKKKFFKDFGKVMNRIEALARGESLANVEAREQQENQQNEGGKKEE